MRPGGLYALRWSDIDETERVIRIQRAHNRGRIGSTKTDDPREAALTPQLIEILQAQRESLIRRQHPGLAEGLVFPAANGGFRGPQALLPVLGRCSKAAGLDIKVGAQILRRTFNTLAVEANVPREVLRAQVGHVSQAMTDRYAGIHSSAKQSMVELLHQAVDLH